ncbi:MAG: hypothetical protein M0Z71_09090 [Nitrospiraceae bacterium]|nr:hypothetical protein [Nitrospiraceae bacterium]
MFKKAVFLAVLIMALSFGSAFADQIDSLSSGGPNIITAGPVAPTQLYVNPGGLGDVLIYGYYNVRGQDQFFTVTNTSDTTGARVRIRFREAAKLPAPECQGSHEVLDFDICLSAGDMWTGRLFTGADGAAWIKSTDIDTYVQTSGLPDGSGTIGIFTDLYPTGVGFKYGSKSDNSAITADMTREGYFEIIGERALSDVCGATGQPPCTCGNLIDVVNSEVPNSLMGHSYMIKLGTFETYGYLATPIANFTLRDITPADGIGSAKPDLEDNDDFVLTSTKNPITPVNYALTKNHLYGIYDIETAFSGNTAYVVTFPTKSFTHTETVNSSGKCVAGSDDIFDDPSVYITIWDDKENTDNPSQCEFSPCPPGTGNTLPDEVTVLNIENSSVFGTGDSSANVTKALNFQTATFDFGWIDIDLYNAGRNTPAGVEVGGVLVAATEHMTTVGTEATLGLPAIGYQALKVAGGKATGMMPMQYSTSVVQPR